MIGCASLVTSRTKNKKFALKNKKELESSAQILTTLWSISPDHDTAMSGDKLLQAQHGEYSAGVGSRRSYAQRKKAKST